MLAFRVLGPLEVRAAEGQPVVLPRRKQRALLVLLLTRAGSAVTSNEMVDALWGDQPPLSARSNIHMYLSGIRKALAGAAPDGRDRLRLDARGYRLDITCEEYDATLFEALVDQGRTALLRQRPDVAAERIGRALGLWRGTVLEDLDRYEWLAPFASRLEDVRLAALEDHTDARLALGQHADVARDLAVATVQHPLRERLWGQLMTALNRCGRRAEALLTYDRMSTLFRSELGVEPGPSIRALYRDIRTDGPDDRPDAVSTGDAPDPLAGRQAAAALPDRGATRPAPAQLPADARVFIGRERELAALTAALAGRDEDGGVVAISGMAGIGKTWLAVRWAHQNRTRYPDGQLFVDLRGFHVREPPMAPGEALRGFLDALGVEPHAVPTDVDALTGLYRTLTHGRQMVVVLDNAFDCVQVVRLLPGSSRSAVLITSRRYPSTLIVRHSANPVQLGPLRTDEARQLLSRRIGDGHLEVRPDAVRQILSACDGLPLALGIVAARAAVTPRAELSTVATELRDARTCLDALDEDATGSGLRAALDSSYRSLDTTGRAVLLRLGVAGVPDLGTHAIAALSDEPYRRVGTALRALERQSLLVHRVDGRWSMHKIVRLYAAERAAADLPEGERTAALSRLVDHYLHTARAADSQVEPAREPIDLNLTAVTAGMPSIPDAASAWRWYHAEHHVFAIVQQHAADLGRHTEVWQLALMTDAHYRLEGRLVERLAAWQTGLVAAQRLGEPGPEALARRFLGSVYAMLGRHKEAAGHLTVSLHLAEQCGDAMALAHAHRALSHAYGRAGNTQLAHDQAVEALRIYRGNGDRHLAHALNGVGWYAVLLRRYDEAYEALATALVLARREGDRGTEVNVLDSLGYLHGSQGEHNHAVPYYERAVGLARELRHAQAEMESLERLGDSYAALGRSKEARTRRERASAMYRTQQRHAATARLERQLSSQR